MLLKIKKLDPTIPTPHYAHPYDACIDVYSKDERLISPGQITMVATGLQIEVPVGYQLEILSKSGLACREGLIVLNAPGIVDAGYTGEIQVIMIVVGDEICHIRKHQKIAQMRLTKKIDVEIELVDEIKQVSERGAGGFGSTGLGLGEK